MDSNISIVLALLVVAFAVALVIGVWQWSNSRRARQHQARSSIAEPPLADGSPRPIPASLAGDAPRAAALQRRG